MATDKKLIQQIDSSDLSNYPNGRIRDNSGAGDGTPVNRLVYGDLHEFFAKLMRLANIPYNGLPDNESNGYQLIDALIQLGTKNDFIYNLTSVAGTLKIDLNLANVKLSEYIIVKATANFANETQIKGSGNLILSVNVSSDFKANEYLRLVKTNSGITIIRLADADNVNLLVAENNFLKSASDLEEFAGISTVKATTPYTNQLAFARRVIGLDSALFLATTLRNGLLSKEDKLKIDNLANPVKNIGWFSGLDVSLGSSQGASLPRSGDVVSAIIVAVFPVTNETTIRVTVANPMQNNSYFVRMSIESEGDIYKDNDITHPVFKKETNSSFLVSIKETDPGAQSLKFHLEVVQIS